MALVPNAPSPQLRFEVGAATAQSAGAPELESVMPADGAVVSVAPTEVRLNFSVPIFALLSGSTLSTESGAEVPVRISVDDARRVVTLTILNELEEGRYFVSWEVRSDLERTARGRTKFDVVSGASPEPVPGAVANPPRASGSAADGLSFAWPSALIRAVGWLLTATAVGVFAFLAAVQAGGLDELRRLVIVLRRLGLLLIVVALIETLITAMRVDGGVGAALDFAVLVDVLGSATGIALVLRAVGGLILAIGSYEAAKPIDPVAEPGFLEPVTDPRSLAPKDAVRLHLVRVPLAIAGSLMLIASMVILASVASSDRSVVGYGAMVGHHLSAALWLGAGFALLSVCVLRAQKGRSLRRGSVVIAGTQLAGVGLLIASVSGVILALGRVEPLGHFFSTAAGRIYLVKTVLALIAGGVLVQLNAQTRGGFGSPSLAKVLAVRVIRGWRLQTALGVACVVLATVASFVLT